MSLESALEEERLEILKLLERPAKSPPPVSRSAYGPSSPLGSRATSPNRAKVTSMIDLASPPNTLNSRKSPAASPTLKHATPANNNGLFRTRLDSSGASGPPRLLRDLDKAETAGPAPHDAYSFNMGPSIPSAVPKRVSQAGKSKVPPPNRPIRSMLGDPTDYIDSKGKIKRSGSPATNAAIRAQMRSTSPRAGWSDSARTSTGRLSSPPPAEHRYSLPPDETQIDLSHAYARLNDEALSKSGGILGKLPEKKAVLDVNGQHIRAGSGESLTRDGGVRLQKDYDYNPNAEKAIADSSDDRSSDNGESSGGEGNSEDDDGGARGRRKNRTEGESESDDAGPGKRPISSLLNIDGTIPQSKKKGGEKKKAMSLLAAAEEERASVSSKYKVKSLLPSISVTQPGSGPNGPSMIGSSKRTGVHPNTNFDVSHASSPMSSETEADLHDLRRAQRMEMIISPITSTPETHRVVRTIVRGDYDSFQEEIENEQRRQRTYLVATDMSGEAAHALEWTIGTVLRDGDTLLAIYAVDEDSVDSSALTPTSANDNGIPEGVVMAPASPRFPLPPPLAPLPAQVMPSSPMISFSTPVSRSSTPPPSASRRGSGEKKRGISRDRNSIGDRTKAELERISAAESITQLVTKLLKKTRLQVRCVVEVIHCKSPKHLLTEMIDYIEPTLVILGSRGRSALKGVLLGSFSNYLVTKSSVPVMVARKKLKHHSKSKKKNSPFNQGAGGVNVRLTNNLVTGGLTRVGSGLAMAKVD